MRRISFYARKTTKTKRPVRFRTSYGQLIRFKARRPSIRRTKVSFLARTRR